MGIIMLKGSNSAEDLMHKARKLKMAVCDFVDELEDTAQDMRDEFGEDTAYRYDERYPDRWYRKNMDREYRGGRYDYKRY